MGCCRIEIWKPGLPLSPPMSLSNQLVFMHVADYFSPRHRESCIPIESIKKWKVSGADSFQEGQRAWKHETPIIPILWADMHTKLVSLFPIGSHTAT